MYRIEKYEHELKSTYAGRKIMEVIMDHAQELNSLVNHNRSVMVTWKRNNGAAFISQYLATGFDPSAKANKEIVGIQFTSLIRRMAVVLQDHGSAALAKTLDIHLLSVLEFTETHDSLYQVFQKLKQYERQQA